MLAFCLSGGPSRQPLGAQSKGRRMETGPGGVNGHAQHNDLISQAEGSCFFGVQESFLSCKGRGKASEDLRKKMLTIMNQHGFTKKRDGLPVVLFLWGAWDSCLLMALQ